MLILKNKKVEFDILAVNVERFSKSADSIDEIFKPIKTSSQEPNLLEERIHILGLKTRPPE